MEHGLQFFVGTKTLSILVYIIKTPW